MPLLLVQSFLNTRDADRGTDLLLDSAAARDWLAATGLLVADGTPGPADLDLARHVREAIRVMLVANGGGPAPAPGALQPVRAVAKAVRPSLEVGPAGELSLAAEPAGKIATALLALLLIIRDAQRDGTWQRLKACSNPDCQWAYYDRSHGQAGAWCDMATCGNRIKNRRLRQRQH
jgi:predicted RNA-binding Zn ribbon-like protein